MTLPPPRRTPWLAACLIGGGLTLLMFGLTFWQGLDLADEGFYWYGAQRLLQGELPLRDFMSYDPGRYLWAAGWMGLLGNDGLWVARWAVWAALIPAHVLLVALLLRCHGSRWPAWLGAALLTLTLCLLVFPYYKGYDNLACLAVLGMAWLLLTRPDTRSTLLAGVLLGLAATIGRNHGVYGIAAALILVPLLLLRGERLVALPKRIGLFVGGVLVGYAPVLLLIALAPGYAAAFVDSVLELFRIGSTNLAAPIPWPWRTEFGFNGLKPVGLHAGLVGLLFMLLPAAGLLVVALARRREAGQELALAAAVVALPYAHYAYSRPDMVHLSLSLVPLVVAVVALARVAAWLLPLLVSAGFAMRQPGLEALLLPSEPVPQLGIHAGVGMAKRLDWFERLLDRHQARGSWLALPHMPGLHAIHRQRMAVWDIYVLFARAPQRQRDDVAAVSAAAPKLILISDHALDGMEERRFSRLQAPLMTWVQAHYVLQAPDDEARGLQVWIRR